MFAAGETSTTVVSIAAAAYAARTHTPGGHALLAGSIVWAIAATITTAIVPKGDYAKALRALGWRKAATPKPAQATRARTTGPGRRGPRGHELRTAVAGWTAVNLALIAVSGRPPGPGSRGSALRPGSLGPRGDQLGPPGPPGGRHPVTTRDLPAEQSRGNCPQS